MVTKRHKRVNTYKFRIRNVQTQSRECVEVLNKSTRRSDLASGHVALQAHAVDRDALALQRLDEVLGTRGLGTGLVAVVIVVVEFGVGISRTRCLEGQGDVVAPDGARPD
jgi:hypothetical protein